MTETVPEEMRYAELRDRLRGMRSEAAGACRASAQKAYEYVDRLWLCGVDEFELAVRAQDDLRIVGLWRLYRIWHQNYYWVVLGSVPIQAAYALYCSRIGRRDVRVDGHCGRPAPEPPWLTWYADGKEVHGPEAKAEMQEILAKDLQPEARAVYQRIYDETVFVDDLARDAVPYVNQYHIDSDLGLHHFLDRVNWFGGFGKPMPNDSDLWDRLQRRWRDRNVPLWTYPEPT